MTRFLVKWKQDFPWLIYDNEKMYCKTCKECKERKFRISKNNNFATSGNTSFKHSTLLRHQDGNKAGEKSSEHRRLLTLLRCYPKTDALKGAAAKAEETRRRREAEKQKPAVNTLFHAEFWLMNNELPSSKYDSLVK